MEMTMSTHTDYSIRPAAIGFTVTHVPSGMMDVFDLRGMCERWIARHAAIMATPTSTPVVAPVLPSKGLTVGKAAEMGLDDEGGAWAVVCEAHKTVVNVKTRKEARTVSGIDFCEQCMNNGKATDMSVYCDRLHRFATVFDMDNSSECECGDTLSAYGQHPDVD